MKHLRGAIYALFADLIGAPRAALLQYVGRKRMLLAAPSLVQVYRLRACYSCDLHSQRFMQREPATMLQSPGICRTPRSGYMDWVVGTRALRGILGGSGSGGARVQVRSYCNCFFAVVPHKSKASSLRPELLCFPSHLTPFVTRRSQAVVGVKHTCQTWEVEH